MSAHIKTQQTHSFLTHKLPQIIAPRLHYSTLVSLAYFLNASVYVCYTAAIATGKYCHLIPFICAQLISSRAWGNAPNAPRTYVDDHVY